MTDDVRAARISRAAMKDQLERMAGVLSARLHTLDFAGKGTSGDLEAQARTLGLMLVSPEEGVRRMAAEIIAGGLLDKGDASDPLWWGTDLGRAMGRAIGHVEPVVSRTTARHLLGVSRQAVDQMVTRRELHRAHGTDMPGGVSRATLQQVAARRWPITSDIYDWPPQTD